MTRFSLFILVFLQFLISPSQSQEPVKIYEDITITIPSGEKTKTTFFTFNGGLQLPFWVMVPMVPDNSPDLKKRNESELSASGWFAGAGIIKTTRSPIEVGLLFDYLKSSVPVAFKGQRSYGDWVYEQTDGADRFTDVQENDIDRITETLSIRAVCRYKYLFGNAFIWAGVTAGTYSNSISYGNNDYKDNYGVYRQISLGAGLQAGGGFTLKNKNGEDFLGFNVFGDFLAPVVNDQFANLFNPGWTFENVSGNRAVSPVRIGISFDLH